MTSTDWPTRVPQAYLPCGAALRLEAWPYLIAAAKRLVRRQTEGFRRWHRHRRTLRALSKLDAHGLKDIGLSGGPGSIHAAAKAIAIHAPANENHEVRAA